MNELAEELEESRAVDNIKDTYNNGDSYNNI